MAVRSHCAGGEVPPLLPLHFPTRGRSTLCLPAQRPLPQRFAPPALCAPPPARCNWCAAGRLHACQGEWYMLPEAAESGHILLYRARRFPYDWEAVAKLLTQGKVQPAANDTALQNVVAKLTVGAAGAVRARQRHAWNDTGAPCWRYQEGFVACTMTNRREWCW